jgi:hypothetical protein
MRISAFDPIQPAMKRTQKVLFQPFDFGKWLRLGFCAFLMTLAGGGGGGGGGGSPGGGGGGNNGGPDLEPAMDWIAEHFVVIAAVVAAIVLVIFLFGMLLTWLSSRGHFMFLDGVVQNRGAVVQPWHEYRREGNSLFLFRLCLALVGLVAVAAILAVGVLIAWPDFQQREFGPLAVLAIVWAVVSFMGFALVMGVIGVLLKDFVVPIMYLRRIPVLGAWRIFSDTLLRGHSVAFVVYLLVKFLLSVAVGFLALGITCATCCVAIIPYVGSVILLPLTVFLQAYPLCFLEQFGPEWAFFEPASPFAERKPTP